MKELKNTDAEIICKFEELSNFNVKPNLTCKIRDYCATLNNLMKEKLIDRSVMYKVTIKKYIFYIYKFLISSVF